MNRTAVLSFLTALAALATGCAHRPTAIAHPVGPSHRAEAAAKVASGTLIVHTAPERHGPAVTGSDSPPDYSGYEIRSVDGKRVKIVENRSVSFMDSPTRVPLPPGEYKVVAMSNGYGWVTVPVIVAESRVTRVNLAGEPLHAELEDHEAVRLPGGEIIGWKAATDSSG